MTAFLPPVQASVSAASSNPIGTATLKLQLLRLACWLTDPRSIANDAPSTLSHAACGPTPEMIAIIRSFLGRRVVSAPQRHDTAAGAERGSGRHDAANLQVQLNVVVRRERNR